MLRTFHNEAEAPAGEVTLRLVIDFRVVDIIEGMLGQGMDEILPRLMVPNPPHSLIGKVLWAMLREHHSEITLGQVAGLLYDDAHGAAIGAIAGDLVRRAFNIGEPRSEGEKRSRPPRKRRGASKPS